MRACLPVARALEPVILQARDSDDPTSQQFRAVQLRSKEEEGHLSSCDSLLDLAKPNTQASS